MLAYLMVIRDFKNIKPYINSLKESRYGSILDGFFFLGEYIISRREILGDRGT